MNTSRLVVAPKQVWDSVIAYLSIGYHQADIWKPADTQKPATVADIRLLQLFASRTPQGTGKIAFVLDASEFRPETANALLKILEEPPEYLQIILISQREYVMATIQSRVRLLTLPDSATIQTSSIQPLSLWDSIKHHTDITEPVDRELLLQLHYMNALIHTTIQPETILEPFIPTHIV